MSPILDSFSLDGKVSLVTGGSRGLGLGMATALAEAGSEVVLVSRTKEQLEEARQTIKAQSGKDAHVIAGDVANLNDINAIVEGTLKKFQHIDILINNAGINCRKPFMEITPEEFDGVMAVNIRAVYFLSQRVARHMIERGQGGNIIHTASLSSFIGISNISVYGSTKGAVASLTKQMAVELAPHKIRVNAIAPGYFETSLTQKLFQDEKRVQWMLDRTPLGRTGKPDDLKGIVVFLASAASDYTTGTITFIDGGWMAS